MSNIKEFEVFGTAEIEVIETVKIDLDELSKELAENGETLEDISLEEEAIRRAEADFAGLTDYANGSIGPKKSTTVLAGQDVSGFSIKWDEAE